MATKYTEQVIPPNKEYRKPSFEFKWSVSKARDTAGYNICSLWVYGTKVASCDGGGYDMEGTVLGEWMLSQKKLVDKLKKLPAGDDRNGFYGLKFYKDRPDASPDSLLKYEKGCRVSVDGGCGWNSMIRILNACGYTLKFVNKHRDNTTYVLERYRQKKS